jgi:hypothetical protein
MPGTFYWGIQLKPEMILRDEPALKGTSGAYKSLVYNTAPVYFAGKYIGSHSKLLEGFDNMNTDHEAWGQAYYTPPHTQSNGPSRTTLCETDGSLNCEAIDGYLKEEFGQLDSTTHFNMMKFFIAGKRLMAIDICADYFPPNARNKDFHPSASKIFQSKGENGSEVKFDMQFVMANGMRFKSVLTPNVYLQEGGFAVQADGKGLVTSARAFRAAAVTTLDASVTDVEKKTLDAVAAEENLVPLPVDAVTTANVHTPIVKFFPQLLPMQQTFPENFAENLNLRVPSAQV